MDDFGQQSSSNSLMRRFLRGVKFTKANRPPHSQPGILTPKFHLHTTLVVPFVLQIMLAVGLVGYLSFRNGQKAVRDLANQLQLELSERVSQHLNQYLETPRQVNEINLGAAQFGILNLKNLDETGRYFWKQMTVFRHLSYINFGSKTGEFVGVGRENDGSLYLEIMPRKSVGQYRRYALDSQGKRTRLLNLQDFSFQQDAWYANAVTARKPVWSSIYPWSDRPEILSISSSYPVYTADNQLVGVLGIDFILAQISEFLKHLNINPSNKVFIIERNGLLVASSSQERPYSLVNGKTERLNVLQSQDELIRSTSEYVTEQLGAFDQIQSPQILDFTRQGERKLVRVTPWQDAMGLDWLIVIVVPESSFMAQIHINNQRTVFLCVVALIVAIVVGIFTTRLITQPILRLTQAAQALTTGNLQYLFKQSSLIKIDEIETLEHSFDQMAEQVQQSLADL
ncbi:MAG: cache and HAMP domain-containing protein, partial [Leptolyngbyaceae cyanobacterium bins.59]|nr:cache and HAMP domain-containing protein [Leptolyngbyaceae cyanobacterium bins.59]